MFEAIGRFSYRFRWWVIGLWVVLFAVSVAATPLLADVLQGGFSNPKAPAERAGKVIEERFHQGPTIVLILFKSETLKAADPAFQEAEQQALAGLTAAGTPFLDSIQTYASTGNPLFLSKDGRSSVAVLSFSAPLHIIQNEVEDIRTSLRDTGLQTYVTGEPAINADLTTYSFRDAQRVELYALPVALVALIFVFGSLVSAALPIVTGGLAVTVTLGGMYLLGRVTSMSIFAMNTATLLGLAVAIDYALFIVSRFREELQRGATTEEAVVVTSARAGRSIFYSGLAVMVAVLGLLFFPSTGLRSLGIGGALVVFFSVAASLTFMPALMGVLGHRVNTATIIKLQTARESRVFGKLSSLLLRRPWISIVGALVLIALIASPAFKMEREMTSVSTLPQVAEARQGFDILEQEFDYEALSPVSVLLTWDGSQTIDMSRAARLFIYGQKLADLPGVASVMSPFTVTGLSDPTALASFWPQFEALLNDPDGFVVPPEGVTVGDQVISAAQLGQFKQLVAASIAPGAALYRVVLDNPPASAESRQTVGRVLDVGPPAGYELHVAGETASSYDFFKEIDDWFPLVIIWVVVTSFIVFVFLLRSLLLPLVAVIVNLFTIAMSYGLLVLIFQGDTFEGLLNFTSTGAIDAIVPVVMLCIFFGVTMDYAVFMLTRMHERWLRTGNNKEAVTVGLVRTARIILSAGLLVVIVTGAFSFSHIKQTKMLGMGIALAIIADVLLIRMALLPAIMSYLGRANWWWPGKRYRSVFKAETADTSGEAPAGTLSAGKDRSKVGEDQND
ncbi:MAG: MMPL family transporter [Thermoleophilia bacterium]|jgi:RND superfamily putative drug exporter